MRCEMVTLACLLGLWLGACSTVPPGPRATLEQDIFWPPPPEPRRVTLLTEVSGPADLMGSEGVWASLRNLLAGRSESTLVAPSAIAVHETLGAVIADTGLPGVHHFDWPNGRHRVLEGTQEHPLDSPVGVAVGDGGTVFVSDSGRGQIAKISAEGDWLGAISDPENLRRPAGIAWDSQRGELVVVDVLAHGVHRFTPAGEHLAFFGGQGTASGEFNFPTHVAVAPDGRMAVTDTLNFRIQILSADGTPLLVFGELGDAPGYLARPKGVAFDAQGNLWVVDAQFENLQCFDDQGRLLLHLGGPGQAPGRFWLPSGLTIDSEQRLWVADTHNHRAQIFLLHTPEPLP